MNWLARSRTSARVIGEPVGMAVTEQQVPGGLGDPHAGGVVCDPCEVHGSGGDVDAQQQVEPA